MLTAGRHEEAADAACQLFDDCREAGMQVPECTHITYEHPTSQTYARETGLC